MNALLAVVKGKSEAGSITGKRDYALLLHYFLTGLCRREVIPLRGSDIEIKDKGFILKYRRKGGKYAAREILDRAVLEALLDYLTSSNRSMFWEQVGLYGPGMTGRAAPAHHSLRTRLSRI